MVAGATRRIQRSEVTTLRVLPLSRRPLTIVKIDAALPLSAKGMVGLGRCPWEEGGRELGHFVPVQQ